MGNEMLRSLVVFGYGEAVHKICMAELRPFSLNEKHLSLVRCGRRLRVCLLHFLFFHRGQSQGSLELQLVHLKFTHIFSAAGLERTKGSTAQPILRQDTIAMSAAIA